jgi:hypothetical protein
MRNGRPVMNFEFKNNIDYDFFLKKTCRFFIENDINSQYDTSITIDLTENILSNILEGLKTDMTLTVKNNIFTAKR